MPSTDVNLETLDLRVYQQIQSIWKFKVPYEFRFSDQLAASGITFEHHATDDSLRDYKAVHYDHGTGVSAADVDGDGKTDVYFVNQLGGNELWKNLGGGRFQNITAKAGVALKDKVSVAAAFADIDNDGDQDLFVTTVKFGNALFENDGHGVFKDITKAAGVDFSGHSSAAFFFDYDKDGKLDLFVTNLGIYTQDGKGRGGFYLGLVDAFRATPTPSAPTTASSTATSAATNSRTSPRPPAWSTAAGAATPASTTSTATAGRRLLPQHAGRQPLLPEPGRQDLQGSHGRIFPPHLVGRHGHQILRPGPRRRRRPLHHRHAFGHEPRGPAGLREDQEQPCRSIGKPRTTSRAIPSSRTRAANSSSAASS